MKNKHKRITFLILKIFISHNRGIFTGVFRNSFYVLQELILFALDKILTKFLVSFLEKTDDNTIGCINILRLFTIINVVYKISYNCLITLFILALLRILIYFLKILILFDFLVLYTWLKEISHKD